MNVFELSDIMNRELPVYAVDIKTYSVKKKLSTPVDPNAAYRIPDAIHHNEQPILYKLPTVVKMYPVKFEEMKGRVDCRRPLDFKPAKESTSYIDYSKQVITRLHSTQEEAEKLITPELIRKFLDPRFVMRFPQIMDRHPILKEVYAEEIAKKEAEKAAKLEDEELLIEEE